MCKHTIQAQQRIELYCTSFINFHTIYFFTSLHLLAKPDHHFVLTILHKGKGYIYTVLNCLHVFLTCVFSLCLGPSYGGGMMKQGQQVRTDEIRKFVFRDMRRLFF